MRNMKNPCVLLVIIMFGSLSIFAQSVNQYDDLGRKEGEWIKYFENTKMKYKGQFHKDKPVGKFTHYYNTGEVRAVVEFSSDGITGRNTAYYKSGNKMAEGNYVNQLKDDVWKYFIDETSNSVISVEEYKDGKLNGKSITYYPESGNPAEVVMFSVDKKNGTLMKYFPDGTVMTESNYKNGLPDGEFKHYHPDGKIQIVGMYKDGLQSGNWQYFDENGSPVDESEFLKQEEVKEIE
jgi:antitoxin component YwqK of YwqJK toxin-antitoxin module